jgi:hypothetical protein
MDEIGYHRLLHFFHSCAWCLDALGAHWSGLVLDQQVTVTVAGRAVLLGDHTYVVKDARRMPGVVTLHQDSETQSKPTSCYVNLQEKKKTLPLSGTLYH